MKEKCPYINLKNEFNSPKTMKKSFSSTYNYFQIESKNKKRSTNKYLGVKSIEENKSMNSDFITLSREANIYTSKDKYIKNKKIQLYNNEIQIDNKNKTAFYDQGFRTNIFKNKNHIFYKTTIFRGGKYFFNDEKRKKKLIKKIEKNMPIEKMIDYLEQNEHNLKIFDDNKRKKKLMIEKEQEKKIENNYNKTFYQKILDKKEDILNLIIKNEINPNRNISEIMIKSPKIYSTINLNSERNENNSKRNKSERQTNYKKTKKRKIHHTNLLIEKKIKNIPLVFPKILTSLNKLKLDSENSIKKINPNRFIKIIENNTIDIRNKKIIRKINPRKNNKSWSLALDLNSQKNLYRKEEKKTNIKLKEELKEDIKEIVDEIINKQTKIKEIENKINLTPLTLSHINKNPKNNKKNQKQKQNQIQLRLVSLHEIENSTFNNLKMIKTPSKNMDIFNSNERLYYSWFRDKKKGDINKFTKKNKLTEFIVYCKTKDKILKDKIMGDLNKKSQDN